jgi:hypothetical protein
MRSQDAGRTWEDRKPGGQHDAHYLRIHRQAPGRVYEAAGGGYAESHDAGASWLRFDGGMLHHYCWSVAVDPTEPNLVLVSASRGPMQAHRREHAEATVYRKTKGQPWHEARNGLPEPKGTRVYALASSEHEPGVFYAATHEGRVFRSPDAAMHWHELNIIWPQGYTPNAGMPPALIIA